MKYKIIYHGGSSSSSSSSSSSRLLGIDSNSNNYFTKVDTPATGHLPAAIQQLIFCFGGDISQYVPCGEGQIHINNFSMEISKQRVPINGTQSALWCPIIWNALKDNITIPDRYLTYGNEYQNMVDKSGKVIKDIQKKKI